MKKSKILSGLLILTILATAIFPFETIFAVENDNSDIITRTSELQEIKFQEMTEEELKIAENVKLEDSFSPLKLYAFSTNSYSSTYGYNKLDNNNKKSAYQHMQYAANIFHNSTDDATLSGSYYPAISFDTSSYNLTVEEMFRVYLTFYYDNPQFYWLNAMSYYYNPNTGIVTNVLLTTKQEYALGDTRTNLNNVIESNIQNYLDVVSPMSNDFQKELMIHDALIYYNDYAYDSNGDPETSSFAHNIVGVFDDDPNTAPVCEGYAKAFELLCNASGIDCGFIAGTANGGGHAWNQVKLDDEWYNVDVTWDDPTIINQDPPYQNPRYKYFNVTDSNFTGHTAFSSNGQGAYWCYDIYVCSSNNFSIENQRDNIPDTATLHSVTYNSTEEISIFIFNQGVEVPSTSKVLPNTNLQIQVFAKSTDLADYYYLDVNGTKIDLIKNSEPNSNGYVQYIANYVASAEDMNFQVLEKTSLDFNLILNKRSINFFSKGTKDQIVVTFKGNVVDNSTLTYTSDNPYVAKVDSQGNVTSIGCGEAIITVKSETLGKETTCSIIGDMSYILGDIDNNQEVEIADAYYLLRFLVNRLDYDSTADSVLPAANFDNSDNEIEISDAYSLLRYIVKNT